MSSVASAFAKLPTKTFVVTSIPDSSGNAVSGCWMTPQSGLDEWAADNAADLQVTGNIYTVIDSTMYSTLVGGNGFWNDQYSAALPDDGRLPVGTVLTDLGKDVYIGVKGEKNILHLRLMETSGTLASLGKNGFTGYIVVETNASDVFTDPFGLDRPIVSVARGF